jgi:histidinol-phosphate/aromatic aminotransferase/cobyric acid decarboxylase-like protein
MHSPCCGDCTSFGLPGYVRVSPRLPADNDRLPAALAEVTTAACR